MRRQVRVGRSVFNINYHAHDLELEAIAVKADKWVGIARLLSAEPEHASLVGVDIDSLVEEVVRAACQIVADDEAVVAYVLVGFSDLDAIDECFASAYVLCSLQVYGAVYDIVECCDNLVCGQIIAAEFSVSKSYVALDV